MLALYTFVTGLLVGAVVGRHRQREKVAGRDRPALSPIPDRNVVRFTWHAATPNWRSRCQAFRRQDLWLWD